MLLYLNLNKRNVIKFTNFKMQFNILMNVIEILKYSAHKVVVNL